MALSIPAHPLEAPHSERWLGAPPPASPPCRGSALVVDDSPSDRLLLTTMLRHEGFHIREAADGAAALVSFIADPPDIVFMDILMAGMDGCEATKQIKSLSNVSFVPIIILTALINKNALMRCTEAGADDFLTKPFNPQVLRARIVAVERMRDLQRTITTRRYALAELLERRREEQILAERVWNRAVTNRNVSMEQLSLAQRPATVFNGDLVLTQHLPDGGLRILLGDFTGHGLAAAIGALPVADAFHATARKGVDDTRVLAEINHKLHQILPPDRFLAACLISISGNGEELRWWNGGMPSVWLRNASGLHELASHALPLGILAELATREIPQRIRIQREDRLLVMSDGLLEACNAQGQMFEDAGFCEILDGWAYGEPILPVLLTALDAHSAGSTQADDIAILEIPLNDKLFATLDQESNPTSGSSWQWSLTLEDDRLANQPSLITALRPLGLLESIEMHAGVLETIVTELYSNALEHGILGLDSALKATPEGFDSYYRERERRLTTAGDGRLTLTLTYDAEAPGHCVRIRVTDSGRGFCDAEVFALPQDAMRPWGRGIAMVRDLCESLTYTNYGTEVEAVYRW
ncbi:fused response regulator/phosphatase [Chromatium okenii]|uniref:ATP-binding SpoIIE family protein phosphatase n=1 Tax=Chromatium okenii TaxID=61644 RepID=UPI0026F18300|nr:fused response regulator/phosphatase [Chromatium okenii]MBV5307966.1 fused response regulator/phosphatase [Chromatium okenii]